MQTETRSSVLTLEHQSKLTLTGVARVESFSERLIVLGLDGKRVRIEGSSLKVLAFSEGSGNFAASGKVDAIRFQQGGKGLSRLLR